MKKEKLIILSDYGLDDAAATAYLLKFADHFSGIDIVTVAGNVSAHESYINAQKLLVESGCDTKNIRIVPTDDIKQNFNILPEVHGVDGMGDLFKSSTSKAGVISYQEFMNSIDNNCIVLSLGPLTITKDILQKKQIKNLIIMAGMVNAVPNFEGKEFNQALDIESYDFCLKHSHVVATLDTCRASCFNLINLTLGGNSAFDKIINAAIELARRRHPDNSFIYDYIASLYLTNPEIFDIVTVKDRWGNTLNELRVKDGFCLAEFTKSI